MANMRATIIRNIFQEIDKDSNHQLTLNELHSFLETKTYANTGAKFEYDIAEHFFTTLNVDPMNGFITIE